MNSGIMRNLSWKYIVYFILLGLFFGWKDGWWDSAIPVGE